ncbi:MAG: hypothetical protein KJT01_07955, partial [Gemmatimonadetes bacterium]|nr:hypothetical protein [Gemmatimonadota bacterium]
MPSRLRQAAGAALLLAAAVRGVAGQSKGASPTEVREGNARDRAEWFNGVGTEPLPAPGHLYRLWETEQAAAPALRMPPLFRPGMPNVFMPLGPTALLAPNAFWLSLPQADGGRVASIVPHPTDENTAWIGTAGGGVWRTRDGGMTWDVSTDNLCGLTIGAITVNPVRPTVVYAASGEPVESRAQSCGIFRSTDGGTTWTNLGGATLAMRQVYAIHLLRSSAAGADASAVLLAATNAGMLRSTDGGSTWSTAASGIFTDVLAHPTTASLLWGWKQSTA